MTGVYPFFDRQSASPPDEQRVMCAFTSGMCIFILTKNGQTPDNLQLT